MNKSELIDALSESAGLSKSQASDAVESIFGAKGIVAGALRGGNKLQITGFGSFQVRKREARVGRDPRTGNEVQIKAANVPTFKAGQALKASLNE